MAQTPNRRCEFCGEGVTCQHGYCEECEICAECRRENRLLEKLQEEYDRG